MRALLLCLLLGSTSTAAAEEREPVTAADVPRLVADLRSDDVRWNALRAKRELRRLGGQAIFELEEALRSDDYQQRQCAAEVLRRTHRDLEIAPSDRLLEVTVEGLRDDQLYFGNTISNANSGYRYLVDHVPAAKYHLLHAVRASTDRQQRFLAAFVLGVGGVSEGIERTSAILIEHLADNDFPDDACLACYALYRLGEPVLPYLERARSSQDRQQREAIELLIFDLREPPTNPSDVAERAAMHSLTRVVHDPCLDLGWKRFNHVGSNDLRWRFHEVWYGDSKAPSIVALRAEQKGRLYHKIDHIDDRLLVVAIGYVGKNFDRRLTLRFHADGTVERRETSPSGYVGWMPEPVTPQAR